MLFQPSKKEFSQETFQNPDACYRGAPFWSWNTLMTKEIIEEQIGLFQKMGMGGFHVHVRVGLKNQYMSDEFLELVKFCNEQAKKRGMLCWLYDEDRYASGIAGGEVTKNIFFRARWLKLTPHKDEEMTDSLDEFMEKQNKNEKVKGCFLKAYDITLQSGYLKKASMLEPEEIAEGVKWYLYVELAEESPWCNNQTYVDTLKPEAIDAFIKMTHERYAGVLQDDFGKSIPAIFTDEPHISGSRLPGKAEALKDILLPYTEELPRLYGRVEDKDFFEAIPYLVWNRQGEKVCLPRYQYYKTLSELFANAYCKQIGDWCKSHGLISTGHLLGEENLQGQVSSAGETMRCYREFQLPGIDNLCDHRDFSAAKQAASIAHQYGKEGVLSEQYGVTQWDFNYEGYKLAGDWQAALGITVRVHHLAWASMNGEAKRDYPAAIGWQSPWYEEFSYIENHFARVNYCLTRGKPVIRVGVLHPIESVWILQGPGDQSGQLKKQLEEDFQSITKWLLTGAIDFDYIAESSLEEDEAAGETHGFCCGNMQYEVVVVPSCINLRKTTVERLLRFADAGGTVIFTGIVPEYVDCRRDKALEQLVNRCRWIPASEQMLLEQLEDWREVSLWEQGTRRTNNLLYQLRQEEDCRWLFVAQAYRGMEGRQNGIWNRRALHAPQNLEIKIKGIWEVEQYDTLTGGTIPLNASHQAQCTSVQYEMYGDDSLLLRLTSLDKKLSNQKLSDEKLLDEKPSDQKPLDGKPLYHVNAAGETSNFVKKEPEVIRKTACIANKELRRYYLSEPIGYQMSEPNALLLDRFEYALDEEEYQDACEMLQLDNRLRQRLGLPLRCEALAQPYIRKETAAREHKLHLRTYIFSTTELSDCRLALEEAEHCICTLNGEPVLMEPDGYYVDPAIMTVKLPKLHKGQNELCITMDYGDPANPEWMYVLGDFGICLQGAHAFLYPKPEKLYWGDYTRQGFPFYTGNMTYLVKLDEEPDTPAESKTLQVPHYSGAAIKAAVNDGEEQMLVFLPYVCELTDLKEQDNILRITCLGNRYNGFGQLHLIGDDMVWLGPDSWRSGGPSWTDTYQVKPMGILTAPQVIVKESSDD